MGLPLSPGKPGQKLETQASVQAAMRPRPLPPALLPPLEPPCPVLSLPWGLQNKRSSTYLACSSKFSLQPLGGLPGAGTPGQRRRWGQEAPLVSGFRVPSPSSPYSAWSPAFWETLSRLPLNSVNLGVLCGEGGQFHLPDLRLPALLSTHLLPLRPAEHTSPTCPPSRFWAAPDTHTQARV